MCSAFFHVAMAFSICDCQFNLVSKATPKLFMCCLLVKVCLLKTSWTGDDLLCGTNTIQFSFCLHSILISLTFLLSFLISAEYHSAKCLLCNIGAYLSSAKRVNPYRISFKMYAIAMIYLYKILNRFRKVYCSSHCD